MNKHALILRLQEWGIWRIKIAEGGLGYPKQSIITQSPMRKNCRKPSLFICDNEGAEEIDYLIVTELAYNYKRESMVILAEYTYRGSQKDKARSLGISIRTYYSCLQSGKMWLAGRLTSLVDMSKDR